MELNPDFLEFIECLEKNETEYLVVGGYAVALHGFPIREDLIRNKIASGRPKDRIDVIELEKNE